MPSTGARDRGESGVRRAPRPARRRGGFSALTRRILAINLLALLIAAAGVLYLDTYRRGLIEAKIAALGTQGKLIAAALGESVVGDAGDGPSPIDAAAARQLLARLAAPIETRARLYDARGDLVADSRRLPGTEAAVQAATLPPPPGAVKATAEAVYSWVISLLPARRTLDPYVEAATEYGGGYAEVHAALAGEPSAGLRDGGEVGVIVNVAVPVQPFKLVRGALLLTAATDDIEDSVRDVRYAILQLFAVALAITVLLSLYLAGTIARPVHRLAEAADAVRHDRGVAIPDFSARGDEIGDLSQALRAMTQALAERMDAIESFAADVAHEIKNPLSSLRSAVETAVRVEDPERRRELLAIAADDVQRLDRLISDISDASRLDAELARAESGPVDIGALLAMLVEVDRATTAGGAAPLSLERDAGEALVVSGVEGRLAQVFRNLVTNARTFSPPGGVIRIAARRDGDWIEATVEDAGPGLPPGALAAIFERFYTERPPGEKFGTHSGLGLSISKQIIEAHDGAIFAENLGADPNRPEGARFVVRLPV